MDAPNWMLRNGCSELEVRNYMITWDRKQGIEWVLFGFLAHRSVFLRSNDRDDVYVGRNSVHEFHLRVLDREDDRSEFIILET